MAATVTSKWRVTIPKPVREFLGLVPGSRINFEMTPDGRVMLVRTSEPAPAGRFAILRGRADPGLSTDAIMALTRSEP